PLRPGEREQRGRERAALGNALAECVEHSKAILGLETARTRGLAIQDRRLPHAVFRFNGGLTLARPLQERAYSGRLLVEHDGRRRHRVDCAGAASERAAGLASSPARSPETTRFLSIE